MPRRERIGSHSNVCVCKVRLAVLCVVICSSLAGRARAASCDAEAPWFNLTMPSVFDDDPVVEAETWSCVPCAFGVRACRLVHRPRAFRARVVLAPV